MKTEIEIWEELMRVLKGSIRNDPRYLKGYNDALNFVLSEK